MTDSSESCLCGEHGGESYLCGEHGGESYLCGEHGGESYLCGEHSGEGRANMREYLAMTDRPRFFDDIAGVAGGAISALAGLREEAEAMMRARLDDLIQRLDLVRREELDAVQELAANARAGQEAADAKAGDLERRLAALEKRVSALESPNDAVEAPEES